jgi:hypothetical protein
MESVNKSFDVNEVFSGVEKSFEKYNSVDSGGAFEKIKASKALSVEVVSGLTDILKNVLSKPKFEKSEIANRFCEFVDMISGRENGVLWSFARRAKDGEVLTSFLKELATKGCISQIDKIFRCGGYRHPLVNDLSCNPRIENEFNELFSMLPEDYRDKLSGEIISYQDGDKDYAYPLIGGSALMGF